MRKVRYLVAASLDGYIAGPNGEIDWIIMDPEIDFQKIYRGFDAAVMGRLTYEAASRLGRFPLPGIQSFVFSRNLRQADHPHVTVVAEDAEKTVLELRAQPGNDIWLFGGGALFRSLASAGLVDNVEVAVMPVLLGSGVPLLPGPASRINLSLSAHKVYRSGIVSLDYEVTR